MSVCVFCLIASGDATAHVVREWVDTIAIVPLNPVVDGHILVIPKVHVRGIGEDPVVSGTTMARVAALAGERDLNVITSQGAPATQSVFHLHIHVVPRHVGDGLHLPWTGQVVSG